MPESDRQIRRHLLGLSSEAERAAAADLLLTDETAYDAVIAQEQELIDAYIAGELSGEERIAFERQCRLNPELSERLAVATGLTPPKTKMTGVIPIRLIEKARPSRPNLLYWGAAAAM